MLLDKISFDPIATIDSAREMQEIWEVHGHPHSLALMSFILVLLKSPFPQGHFRHLNNSSMTSGDLSADIAGIPQSLPHEMTQTVTSAIDILVSQPFQVSSCMKDREK